MIAVTTFSQRDPKWANIKLGFPVKYTDADGKEKTYTTTIGQSGCTITSLSSLISYVYQETYTPDKVNEILKGVGGFVGPLVLWSRIPLAFGKLKWIKRVYSYNNLETSYYVYVRKMPVLVEVNAAKIGAPRHWVLFLGNQKMLDPWDGTIKGTNTYPPTGEAFIQKA